MIVNKQRKPINNLPEMSFGNKPVDGGNLLLSKPDLDSLSLTENLKDTLIKRIYGAAELIRGTQRYCLWISDENLDLALKNNAIRQRIEQVRALRMASKDSGANEMAKKSHQMREMQICKNLTIAIPIHSSESRKYLPIAILNNKEVITNAVYGIYDSPLWNFSILCSKIHLTWIAAVCGQLETRYRYSNTLGWNTFPIPKLTEKNKVDLTRCAENILLAREVHFPASIAELYDPENMPDDLRKAHDENDKVLERIYIGRCFKNDTERLEKLFSMYTEMTIKQEGKK